MNKKRPKLGSFVFVLLTCFNLKFETYWIFLAETALYGSLKESIWNILPQNMILLW